ncbi:MAG: branched-chain amino acid aminotransferase [Alphaproteobacteria bacterium]|nr:branched-chain amino acid aminotransferase [Alphaproteobacteria bacterium]
MSTERSICYFDGEWREGNPPIMGPMDHAFWLSSMVFDGARAFARLAPDLDQHCERLITSATAMGLKPVVTAREIMDICVETVRRFPAEAELYIRPMFYATEGFVLPDPESTRFLLCVHEKPLPAPQGFSACLSTRRRPAREAAPTDTKAACLYPNVGRALREAQQRGFHSAVILDASGNVAEFATSNLWLVKNGIAITPVPNGTFLAGITRGRVLDLLTRDGIEVVERTVTMDDLFAADEMFSTGNYGKVLPVSRLEDRDFQPGPVYARARELYFTYAKGFSVS